MEVRCKVNKVHVKKGDTVIILSGKDKNKKGKVLEVSPTEQQSHYRRLQHGNQTC